MPYALLVIGVLALFLSAAYVKNFTYAIRSQTIQVTSPAQIVQINERYVRPFLYSHVAGLSTLPTREAKRTFISAVLPAVLIAKHEIEMQKIRLAKLREDPTWDHQDSVVFLDAMNKFNSKDLDDIMNRIGTLPTSIVLAQAALESGWGQSRLFLEGNNLFGIWSFNTNEPRIRAGSARGNKSIYLRAYDNMSGSILNYFEVLASSHAYASLRKARNITQDPFSLLPHLKNFSERRGVYTRQLKTVIDQNGLTAFDDYQIDPDYLFEMRYK